MISSMASITSSSSATVRVEKATSEFLIGPDWTMNMDICDTINSNQMLAKDVVKAVKKRLQHKNPKVQLLALTLLETMVKNCGDYVHFQIAEKNILQDMVKIVKKKTDMHVRDKILTLIGSWHDAFGESAGRYSQYYIAYEDLRRIGVQFPKRAPDSAPVFTPPAMHPVSRNVQPGYGMPSTSTRLDEVMAAEGDISLSSLNSMCEVLDLLADMLQAVDPNDPMAVKDEVITDLVEQCRANQRKLMQMLTTTVDEELLAQGLELNDGLQAVLAKNDAIASGSPLPPQIIRIKPEASERHEKSNIKPAEVTTPTASSIANPSPLQPADKNVIDEEEEEEDDFAQLARRHSKVCFGATSHTKTNGAPSEEVPTSPVVSNALVPINIPVPSTQTKDMDIIDLLSITLTTTASTEETSHSISPRVQEQQHIGSSADSSGGTYSVGFNGTAFNTYVAPWAQPQPQPQPQPQFQSSHSQPQHQPVYTSTSNSRPQYMVPNKSQETQSRYYASQRSLQPSPPTQMQSPQYSGSGYPPPPWAATPGYFSNPSPNLVPRQSYPAYSDPKPSNFMSSSLVPRPPQQPESLNGSETQSTSSPRAPTGTSKPFIPSYRLFEDLNVFGNTDSRFKATTATSSTLSGSNNQRMVRGTK